MKEILLLVITGLLALFTEILQVRKATWPVVLLGLLATLAVTIFDLQQNLTETVYGAYPMMLINKASLQFIAVLTLLTVAWYLLADRYFKTEASSTDFHALIVFSLIGAVCMVAFSDMIMFFLGLEILSIPLYVLAGSRKLDLRSNEAAYKYFLMGAFASAFTLMGITLVYGSTGSFNVNEIAARIAIMPAESLFLVNIGVVILSFGLFFKIAAAPFHFWAPDVYQGAPTPVTAFMAVVVKTAAIAATYIFFDTAFAGINLYWINYILGVSVLSILFGNIAALLQENVKRLLAYSSIAHTGYMLLSIVAGPMGYNTNGLAYYTAAYGIASLILFFILYFLSRANGNNTEISAFEGLGKSHPVLAALTTIALVSMAGIPPTAGFMAKYLLFAGVFASGYTWIVGVAILGSIISLYYYFKIIMAMYSDKESHVLAPNLSQLEESVLLVLAGLLVLLGVLPTLVL